MTARSDEALIEKLKSLLPQQRAEVEETSSIFSAICGNANRTMLPRASAKHFKSSMP